MKADVSPAEAQLALSKKAIQHLSAGSHKKRIIESWVSSDESTKAIFTKINFIL